MPQKSKINQCVGLNAPYVSTFPIPIIANRAPTSNDLAPLGQVWVDESGSAPFDIYMFAGEGNWTLGGVEPATTTTLGIVELATLAELQTGTAPASAVPTANNVATVINGVVTGAVPPAAVGLAGIAQLATQAEVNTGTNNAKIVTPLTLKTAIGANVYPGSFTTLAASGAVTAATTVNVTGLTTLAALTQVGVASINASGAAATVIGTGGTGTVSIGNATGNTAVTGSLTASTSLTATAGDITATLGNVIINGAAKQLRVHGGAVTDFIGTGTLVNGVLAIANTNIATTDRIFLSRTAANASTTLGELTYSIVAATSFTVTSVILGTPGSTQTGDLSSFTYFIVRQV